jgi:hypothetical protein
VSLQKVFYTFGIAGGLDARNEESFRGFLCAHLSDNIAMHLRAFAIDGALQLQTRAMIQRKLCGNHLAVIRSIVPPLGVFFDKRQQLLRTVVQRNLLGRVPEKWRSVSPNWDFKMSNGVQVFGQRQAGRNFNEADVCNSSKDEISKRPLPDRKNWSTLLVFPARPLAGTGSRGFLIREVALTAQRTAIQPDSPHNNHFPAQR